MFWWITVIFLTLLLRQEGMWARKLIVFCVFVCATGKSDFEESIHKENNRWSLFFSEEK